MGWGQKLGYAIYLSPTYCSTSALPYTIAGKQKVHKPTVEIIIENEVERLRIDKQDYTVDIAVGTIANNVRDAIDVNSPQRFEFVKDEVWKCVRKAIYTDAATGRVFMCRMEAASMSAQAAHHDGIEVPAPGTGKVTVEYHTNDEQVPHRPLSLFWLVGQRLRAWELCIRAWELCLGTETARKSASGSTKRR